MREDLAIAAVDKDEIGGNLKVLEAKVIGELGGAKDVNFVDYLRRNEGNGVIEGLGDDLREKFFANGRREFFAVGET